MQLAERSHRLRALLALTESIADQLLAGEVEAATQAEGQRQTMAREIFREPVSRQDASEIRSILESIVDADQRLKRHAENMRQSASQDLAHMNRSRHAAAAFVSASK